MNEEKITKKESMFKKPIAKSIIGAATMFLLLGGFLFWQANTGTIYIENSEVNAPLINISGSTAGTLNELYVKEGEKISADTPVAMVGTDTIYSKQSGLVVSAANKIGSYFTPGETIISIVHPEDMRIIGSIDENKGLDKIKVGQPATFTVDAFGNKTYVGIVDSISQTADDTGVVFSISDKRPIKKFDVKLRFNVSDYPELKDGMSAKITVYTK
ncbi:MAG: efflux RND transporter periplasmic adaptor subunit [Patescibacteria group bacterium]|nr:efflux RND transporter periplasmic adaptor subunit [Patescibacteria group bacterium]